MRASERWVGRALGEQALLLWTALSGCIAGEPQHGREHPAQGADLVRPTASSALSAAELALPAWSSSARVDIWIRGGSVVDGSGAAARRADVVIVGDTVVHVGRVDPTLHAARVIDAGGLLVTPGFIDAHAHSDPFGSVDHLLAMGVTTIVVGQDGSSPDERIKSYLDRVDASRPRVNVATLVGHATVRAQENLGMRTALTGDELEAMSARVDRALSDGAFGLSTGLEYDPGSAAGPAELAAVAEPVGRRGAVVMSHLRSEDDDKVEAAIDELLLQCEAAHARAHVAHLKVVLGRGEGRANAVLARLQAARDRGLSVTADVYPYLASYTTLAILFPPFARPPNDYRAALTRNRKALLAFLKKRVEQRNGPSAMRFGTGAFAGRTLEDVAQKQHRAFEEILGELGPSGGSAAYFVMDQATVRAFVLDPHVAFGTDGSGASSHPRGAGTFARVIEDYVSVGERPRPGTMSIEAMVHKASALPAETLGLHRRGAIAAGAFADVVVFDPERVRDRATFERPGTLAEGVQHVIVGGAVEWSDGKPAAGRGGRALRRAASGR